MVWKEGVPMIMSLKFPELFHIKEENGRDSFGGNQAWYPRYWSRKAGCGATSAANIMSYLAGTRADYANLYSYKSRDKSDYIHHMEELFEYVKPGPMGVNHVDKFVKGVHNYSKSKGLQLKMQVLSVERESKLNRSQKELREFVKQAMELDSPIAFLNLSRGAENRLQDWHWITITSVQMEDNHIWCYASDEGYQRKFDLLLWYRSTKMHGGLICFP